VNYDAQKSFKDGVSLKLLGQHKFDDNVSLKAKADSLGNVALAYTQKAYTNVTLTLCTETNVLKLDDHKVGFTLAFAP